jgi:hypothetical protein
MNGWRTFVPCLLVGALACGNYDRPCNPDFEPGTYDVTVLERWDENSEIVMPVAGFVHAQSCGDALDFGPGDTFTIQTTTTLDSVHCRARRATIVELPGATYTDDPTSGPTDEAVNLSGTLSKADGCRGSWQAVLQPSLEPPSPDRRPPATLARTFVMAPGIDPNVCGLEQDWCMDQYAVQMFRVP